MTIETRIEGGKFRQNRAQIKKALEKFEGKYFDLVFKPKRKPRSNSQNAFYWGVIIPFFRQNILEQWGEIRPDSEIHDLLKSNCNFTEKVNPTTGEILRFPKSTTELSTTEWLEFEHKVNQFSMDFFNCPIPVPNEQKELF